MKDKTNRKEIRRMRQILSQIVEMAEDDELQGGLVNTVRRYNAIVRHLEGSEVLPPGLFQLLNEEPNSVTFHQVGVESRMLSGYLEEVIEEEESSSGKPDFSPVIALAPFLDQGDLKALIQSHLSGRGFAEPKAEGGGNGPPTLRALVGLAPHISKKDLAEMVEACLAREPITDPHLLVALAPHMDRQDMGRILRQHMPNWFEAKGRETAEPPGAPPPPPEAAPKPDWQSPPPRPEIFER